MGTSKRFWFGFCVLVGICAVAFGQGDPPDDFEEVLDQELSQWAEIFWEIKDTDQVPPEAETFEFTYAEWLPRGWSPFGQACHLFERIYAGRLQLDPYAGDLYLLEDLFQDDPDVRESFKEYTITGILRTPLDDPGVLIEHLQIIEEEWNLDCSSYEGTWAEGDALVSAGLAGDGGECDDTQEGQDGGDGDGGTPPLDDDDVPEDIRDFEDQIDDELRDSGIPSIEYKKDYPFFWPGFDCDDYVEAFWAWLKHRQDAEELPEDMEMEALWLYWRHTWGNGKGGKHGKVGHALLVIKYRGYYWIIEPQTYRDAIYGPFPVEVPYEDIDWENLPDEEDIVPDYAPGKILPRHPQDRPWNDPKPWHENPDMCEPVEDSTGHDCDDFIYNSVQ